jgi:hypothetical protein
MADGRRRDLWALGLLAVVIRLPAVLASRHLSFDDGVFGATALALRDGARPYRDVFSSQGPLHQPLLFVADLAGLRTGIAPRSSSIAAGVVVTLCTYLAARAIVPRRAAMVAAVLASTSGSMLVVTTGISGDGPAIAGAAAALAVALATRDRAHTARPLVAGLLVGAACSVKLLAAPVALPVALLIAKRDGTRRVVVAALAAVAVPLACAAPWGYERVWEQSIAYHREPRRYTVGEAAWRLARTLVERDALVVGIVVLVVGVALASRTTPRSPGRPLPFRPATVLGVWLVAQVAVLFAESAMWRPHVSHLVVPLSLLAALRLPSSRAVALVALVAAPVWAWHVADVIRPGGYRGVDAQVAARLRTLPDDAVVVTDEPGFAWRAGLRVPRSLVDTSVKQFDQGRVTERDVLRAARRPDVCAVLVTSEDRLGRFDDLATRLEADRYRRVWRSGAHALYRRACR